jgi:signal transduction histidine kinase
MAEPARATRFASPERTDRRDLIHLHSLLAADEGLCTIIDAMPELVMVLGKTRQILLGNRALKDFAIAQGCRDLLGLRPGELLQCQHVMTAPSGCGTDDACRMCGAVETILAALGGDRASHECRVLRRLPQGMEALDLKVWGTPIRWQGNALILLVAVDISDEKRRKVLERIFFHDILNTAGAINSLTELLAEGILDFDQAKETLLDSARALVSEIRAQRELLAAENNELSVKPTPLHTRLFLEGVANTYLHTELGRERKILFDPALGEAIVFSDDRLLGRVVGNLVKNALEAVDERVAVTLGCTLDAAEVSFWCHNPGVIPHDTQLQIFQRSFSTKEPGRGIGTYSVKLLTERYLKGRVAFISTAASGTIFTVTLPRDLRH